jgi:hypothetical protein
MRRTAASLAVATLGLVAAVAPFTEAQAAPVPDQIRCGTVGPPVCDVLQDLEAQLAPLQPVLALAGPVVADVSQTLHDLLALSSSEKGISSAKALDAAEQLDAVLDLLPKNVRNLLGATALGRLDATLDDLMTALAPVTEPVLGKPAATEGSAPTVMPKTTPRSAAPAPTTASIELDGASLDSGTTSTGSAIPDVPNGGVLDLGPLALPDFGWSEEMSLPATPAAPEAPADVDWVVEAAASKGALGGGTSTAAIVVLFSAMLGAAALAAQWWQSRRAAHTIPD